MPRLFVSLCSCLCSCLCSLVIVTAGCASTGARANANGPVRWTGAFRTSQYAASAVIGPAQPGRSAGYGTITVTPTDVQAGTSRVEISINAPVTPGTQVAWAMFTGQCGSTSPPLIGAMQFPTIEIANSGNGSVRSVLPFALDTHGTYHANVYWSAQATDVSNVMMCANVGLDNR